MKFITYNLKNAEKIIKETANMLKRGGLVIFPSDTVYGLLVDAKNQKAVEKLIKFKNRPLGKPISVFVSDFEMLKKQTEMDLKKELLVSELLPGPFTIILDSSNRVNKLLESEKGTLGVRIPDYDLITGLVKKFASPITATSANLSGRSPHYSVETLMKELGQDKKNLIDLVVDAGKLTRNKPSTIVDLTETKMKILRKGEIIFDDAKSYVSDSPGSTSKIGEFLIAKNLDHSVKKPLVFIIEGEMGSGKTVFVKGIGKKLGIENIVSPTYVIYYEYGNFYHFDLYQIEDPEEFRHLGIEKLLIKNNILVFEWGEKIGELYDMLKRKAHIVYIRIEYLDEKSRKIMVKS
jgi:L-threonylcarbamoyladenylate synthase